MLLVGQAVATSTSSSLAKVGLSLSEPEATALRNEMVFAEIVESEALFIPLGFMVFEASLSQEAMYGFRHGFFNKSRGVIISRLVKISRGVKI
jgi:hypothetical protein